MGFVYSIFYGIVGIALLMIGYKAFEIVLPFDAIQNIKEEKNLPISILYAGVVVALGLVIAASILSR